MFSHCEITKDFSRAKKFFENIVSYTVGPYTLSDMIEQKKDFINVIDVREYDDYINGHIPYSLHIPYKKIKEHLDMLDKTKVNVLYTYNDTCPRAYNTALELIENHFPSVVLRGGFKFWKKSDLEVIKNDSDE